MMAAAEWEVVSEESDGWVVVNETVPFGSADIRRGAIAFNRAMPAPIPEEHLTGATQFERPSWSRVLAAVPEQTRAFAANLIAGVRLGEFERLAEAGYYSPELTAAIAQNRAVTAEVQRTRQDLALPGMSTLQRGVQQGLVSLPVAAPALAAGILTRNPALAAASMYPVTAPEAYASLRARGVEPPQARQHAAFQGVVESGTELLPFAQLLSRLPGGKRLLAVIAADVPGELGAQLLQGGSDYVASAQA